ncbi:hypothetical protein predicted by Glimmer/Critica [Sorangium cellulosum So ce56]|uniref:Uncharacterized protein n=1 Tax=Sorangium cellulosum (strain So ce56) TaxID=448385 RepID=A9GN84_SORC5|nr:hypothetical protein predicted by Glimmer/Critica [Sorangium cellulosum So ce56]
MIRSRRTARPLRDRARPRGPHRRVRASLCWQKPSTIALERPPVALSRSRVALERFTTALNRARIVLERCIIDLVRSTAALSAPAWP